MTPEALLAFQRFVEDLVARMLVEGRPATPEEIEKMERLRAAAHLEKHGEPKEAV